MNDVLPWISIAATVLLGFLVYRTNRRANQTSEKHLTLEEEQEANDREDVISKRRAAELGRLYERVDNLEEKVKALQKADEQKQQTIEDQADELERTNKVLTDVRALFSAFVSRVEDAWTNGHTTMPTLTPQEWALLNETTPRATHIAREGRTP